MSLENIVKKIMAEAQDTANVIQERGGRELEKSREVLATEEKGLIDDSRKGAEAEAEEIIRRRVSSTRLEGRKRVLGEKEMILGEVFAEAKDRLVGLPEDEYLALLKRLVIENSVSGDEVVILSAKDKTRLKGKLAGWVKEINDELKKAGRAGAVVVSDEKRDIEGGLVLSKGRTEMNLSLEVLFSELKLTLEGELMNILFG
jgi:V/A-type H+-transporting ATPase subunit E